MVTPDMMLAVVHAFSRGAYDHGDGLVPKEGATKNAEQGAKQMHACAKNLDELLGLFKGDVKLSLAALVDKTARVMELKHVPTYTRTQFFVNDALAMYDGPRFMALAHPLPGPEMEAPADSQKTKEKSSVGRSEPASRARTTSKK
jgi:hypothetical protein